MYLTHTLEKVVVAMIVVTRIGKIKTRGKKNDTWGGLAQLVGSHQGQQSYLLQ